MNKRESIEMRRSGDDAYVSSQFRRPAEPSGQNLMVSDRNAQKMLTTNDALAYLKAVKEMFQDKRDKYNEFLEVMKDFKSQRTDTDGVIDRVKELFKGHRDLILGFNTFLPKGYEITLPPVNEVRLGKKPVEFKEAISFVNKIKTRFQGDNDHVYKSFLDILNKYKKESRQIGEVYDQAAILFRDHHDLLDEFSHFLPKSDASASIHSAQHGHNFSFHRDEKGSPLRIAKPMLVEKKAYASYVEHDLSAHRSDRGYEKQLMRSDKDQRQHFKEENEMREDREHVERDHDSMDLDDRRQHISSRRKFSLKEDPDDGQSHHGQGPSFCERVRERLQNSVDYQEFLKCLNFYDSDTLTRSQLETLVEKILGRYPDLMEEFSAILARQDSTNAGLAAVMSKRSFWNDGHTSRSVKVEGRERDREWDKEDRDKDHVIRERDRSERGLAFSCRDSGGQRLSSYASKDKFSGKPIQELDLSNCESCTPSYRLLPKNYPIPISSHRTEIGAEVLNDHWVSVTSGSEDYSFKHMRKNQYEESLFRCEDDRFELDMLLESVNTTIRRVEDLLDKMNDDPNPICVEDHFTALNLRCIERLYGDHGLDVVDVSRRNASLALPVILTRLKQKQEEWARCRSDFNKVWAEIYAKNYHKSLDHRSFYFKQQDTKSLSTKVLLAEIKEIFDEKSQHDDMLMCAISGRQQPIVPHLEFVYPDASIHEDLYQLIKYSCGEVCTSEQLDKVLKIWTTFLEPLLGVPPRPQAIEETRDYAKNKEKVTGVMNNDVREKGEQSNPRLNEDGKTLSEHSTSRNDDTVVKGNGSGSTVHETDNICDTFQHVNMSNESALPDKICKSNKPAMSDQIPSRKAGELDSANAEKMSRTCAKEPGYATTEFDGLKMRAGHEIQSAGGTKPESSSVRTNLIQKHKEGPTAHFKIEREEGELSPTGDFEVDNFEECSKMELDAKDSAGSRQHLIASEVGDIHVQDAVGENYADEEGEASARRLSEESETAPGNGDVSASETGEVDCSPEQADEDGANDNKIESEGEVEALANDQYGGDGGAFPERFLQRAKPVTKSKSLGSPNEKMNTQIFYGNDSFYILFRLHYIMYERLHKAKLHSSTAEHKWRASHDVDSANSYSRFVNALYSLLDGSSENAKFEDDCRSIVGTQSYLLFTLDKLIYKIVKQLQSIATDETNNKLLQLKAYEESRSPRRFIDHFYFENIRVFLSDENVYRIECLSSPTKMSIQLMDYWFDKAEPTPVFIDSNFASYLLTDYLGSARDRRIQASAHERRLPAKTYLIRNKRKYAQLDEDDALMEAMEDVHVVNKLELKMQSSSSKVSYVLNTEDLLFRKRKKKKVAHQNGSGNSNGHHAGSSNICRSQIRG